jgi:hypothetical protein
MPRRSLLITAFALIFFFASFSSSSWARLASVNITARIDVANGQSFGDVGPYEKITGHIQFWLDPANPHNKQIVDLGLAEKNKRGMVEFFADFYLLRPKDMKKGNGAVLFEVSNRGGRGILNIVDGREGVFGEYGDGFLMKKGYTIAWLGWEGDVYGLRENLKAYPPVAKAADGKPIVGLVRGDFTPAKKTSDWPLGHILLGPQGGESYAATDQKSPQNVLTVRDTREGQRQVIPRDQWSFAHEVNGKLTADPHFIHLNSGFAPGRIYEVVYVSQDPMVVGVGMAAIRDFLSYMKHEPLGLAPVQRAYAVGISQSGRFLRHFLYQDFNADEEGRQVMDGVIAHVAGAGRGSFNHRFAQPSRDAQPMSSIFFPTDLFPFTDTPQTDPETKETAGLLDAPLKAHTAPKIFYTNTSYEYWGRVASLIHTSVDGKKDVAPPENTRIYFLAGLQHFSRAFPPVKSDPSNPDYNGQQPQNPNPIQWYWRALITDMDEWVRAGIAPPASVYPKLADKTLVALNDYKFPKIPGVNLPHEINLAYRLDFGPQWKEGIVSIEPPKVGKAFPGFVPKADADGNDEGGVRLPELQVPLATYTGWNLRDPSIGAPDQRVSFLGSYIPFARTAEQRKASGDPRLSIAERYTGEQQYLEKFHAAAESLIKQRFMLQEDLPAVMARGKHEWDYVMGK